MMTTAQLFRQALPQRLLPVLAIALAASGSTGAEQPEQRDVPAHTIRVDVGRSAAVKAPWPVTRISVTDPEIADVQQLDPAQILLQGKAMGITDLFMWNEEDEMWRARIKVGIELDTIEAQLNQLFPQSQLRLSQTEDVIFLAGSLRRAEHAVQVSKFMEAMDVKYVNLTSVAGVQQVQVQVRVAEVSRSAMRALGVNLFYTDNKDFFGAALVGSSQGGPLNPVNIGIPSGTPISNTAFTFNSALEVSPVVSLLGGFPSADLEVFIQALAENQYLRILAEPNLVALSGEKASFLAGGEFPIPVVQGGDGDAITIEFREFGVRLGFEPVVLGDASIRLSVDAEVSTTSPVNSVTLQGLFVPSIITRRVQTTLEMKSGQTFAMAGLIQEDVEARKSRIPGLGAIPVLGPLFRSVSYKKGSTELLVLVTASLVEPLSVDKPLPVPGSAHVTPDDWSFYVDGRITGEPPAPVSVEQAESIKQLGLHRLIGPGSWAEYGQPVRMARSPRSTRATGEPPRN